MPNLWIEFAAAGSVALIGLVTGVMVSRLGKRAALAACFCVVAVVLMLAAGWLVPVSHYNSVVFALVAGRIKFVLLAFLVPLGLASAIPYLPYKIERRGVVVMIALSIYVFAIFPFLGSAIAAQVLAEIPARYDFNGVFLQSTPFTCGPAAAATALHRLGLTVSEGQMAVLSRSCPFIGTSDYDLTRAICQVVLDQPINCTYGQWDEIPEPSGHQVMLAIVRQGSWTNHCVTVLYVTDKAVVFADPADGQVVTLSKSVFKKLWTGRGILLQGTSIQ